MERVEGARQPGRCLDHHQSFSSSLLDAIYRSIDESDAGGASRAQPTRGAPDPSLFSAKTLYPVLTAKYASVVAVSERAAPRPRDNYCSHRRFFTSTSSSSDNSSCGGFSSSDAESASTRSTRPRPIRTGPIPDNSDRVRPDPPQDKKKKPGTIRSKLRELRNTRPPVSPGARLASFLNSLFLAASSPKKPKVSAAPPPPPDESACSSASSYSRSCLSKTPSSRGGSSESREKRSVRFGPVSVISTVSGGTGPVGCLAAQQTVEEILRALDAEDEEDDDDLASDSSSDLFELENLTAVGAVGGYSDELPVYETTHFGTNLAIAQGLLR